MLQARLIEHIFKGASMERWNDYARIMKLCELDKQAHKFIIAFFLASIENKELKPIIEAGIFELLARIIITDIRPDVYHKLNEKSSSTLNDWALKELEPLISELDDGEFIKRFKAYFKKDSQKETKKILRAASYLATMWEFELIYQSNSFLSDIDELKAEMRADLEKDFCQSKAFDELYRGKSARLVDLSGRLRFQKRWSCTPRVPATSVLGHMLIVALLSYFYSLKIKACNSRLVSNFYCSLFHDLPESLTRDIISPVKYGAKIAEVLNEYESELIKNKILPFVPAKVQDYFAYLLGLSFENGKSHKDEFENRYLADKKVMIAKDFKHKNQEKYSYIDGKELKACDNLAALLEAGISINFGIKTKELEAALNTLAKKLEKNEHFKELLYELLAYYDLELNSPQDGCGTDKG